MFRLLHWLGGLPDRVIDDGPWHRLFVAASVKGGIPTPVVGGRWGSPRLGATLAGRNTGIGEVVSKLDDLSLSEVERTIGQSEALAIW